MLGDIVSGKTATADVFFLVAVIVFVIAALSYVVEKARTYSGALVAIGLACMALALLVL